ncbi:MAG: cation:proton antiporter [Acidimicrobiales bacterium]
MVLLLAFGALLLVAVLVSSLAHRTVLSTSVLFLVGGALLGRTGVDVLAIRPEDPVVAELSSIALFAVLLTDGASLGLDDLRSAWRLPGRALLLGLPVTFVLLALLGHAAVGLPWLLALLVAAALSPTDPVFASAIVGRPEVPGRLRHLLHVESGLNDGLALPVVVVLLAVAGASEETAATLTLEVVGGLVLGAVVALVAVQLRAVPVFGVAEEYRALTGAAVAAIVFAAAHLTGANLYLAAFAAGVALRTADPACADSFRTLGEPLGELLKLAALLLFGALIAPSLLLEDGLGAVAFTVLALLVARPVALAVALLGSGLDRRERLVAGWFGPRGFASVIYGLLIVEAGIEGAARAFHLIAQVVSASIVVHSSTDVLVARSFGGGDEPDPSPEPAALGDPGAGRV